MLFWLENVWRKRPKAFFCQKSLLLYSCKAHLTAEVKSMISNSSTNLALIPGGLTGKHQPIDLTVNRFTDGSMKHGMELPLTAFKMVSKQFKKPTKILP